MLLVVEKTKEKAFSINDSVVNLKGKLKLTVPN